MRKNCTKFPHIFIIYVANTEVLRCGGGKKKLVLLKTSSLPVRLCDAAWNTPFENLLRSAHFEIHFDFHSLSLM